MMKHLRLLLALLLASAPVAVSAQVQSVSFTGTFTATGATPWLQLSGQGQCSVVLSGTATGVTIVPQVTSDTNANQGAGTAVAVTASGINAGSITYAGTAISYTGNVAAQGLSGFRLNVTAISTGTVTYTERCTAAQSSTVTGSFTPSGTQNSAITSPLAASGAVQTTDCDPTTASRCATVTAGGALTVTGSVTSTTTFPYNAAPQAVTAGSFLGFACQYNGSNSATAAQALAVACDSTGRLTTSGPYSGASTALVGNTFSGIGGSDGANFNPLFVSTAGVGKVSIASTGGSSIGQLGSPAVGATTSGAQYLNVNALPQLWNGTTGDTAYDAVRGNNVNGAGLQANVLYGQYNSSAQAVTTGNYGALQTDPTGTLWVTPGGRATVSVPTNATTVVKGSAGRLARILITTLGAGTLICYDNATTGSGTIIGSYGASAAVGTVEQLDMPAVNGITCVSSATGPVATVSFY